MTRFARAKGSKSSNEKKPEEATSWLEMKNSILSKKTTNQSDKPAAPPKTEVKVEAPRESEWASLGGDSGVSESLLKPNVGKKNKNSTNNKGGEVKKKKKKLSGDGVDIPGDEDTNKKKSKKQKESVSEEVSEVTKNKVKKKDKKRKSSEDNPEDVVPPKKKKKLPQPPTEGDSEKTKKQNPENGKASPKFQKEKKPTKSNFPKNQKEGRNFRSGRDRKQQFDKQKGKKKFRNENFRENPGVEELVINGEKIQIVKFQGFYVTLDDAERLRKLLGEMKKQGIPKRKLEAAIKLERRRAEKALSRLKKSVCFHCRGHGHLLSNCPNLIEKENTGTGICYKCGSTEHTASECKVVKGTDFKFAECFICKEQGHIARQCPDNPRGLYPQGGACRECGDVTHLRKDCPKVQAQKAEDTITVGVRSERDLECLDEEIASREKQKSEKNAKRNSKIKFFG